MISSMRSAGVAAVLLVCGCASAPTLLDHFNAADAPDARISQEAEAQSEPLRFQVLQGDADKDCSQLPEWEHRRRGPDAFRFNCRAELASCVRGFEASLRLAPVLAAPKTQWGGATDADIFVRFHVRFGDHYSWSWALYDLEAVSAYTQEVVYRQTAKFSTGVEGMNGASSICGDAFLAGFAKALTPGSRLYKLVVTQRLAARKSRPAGPSLSSEAIAAAVKSAVREAKGADSAGPARPQAPRSAVDAPRYRTPPDPRNYAVVIGVERYSDLPDAAFAEHDARAVRDHLVALGYPERNIVSLLGADATHSALVANLETWLANNAREDSSVLVYFSGHGSPDAEGNAYLVPWDGNPSYLKESAYSLRRLYQTLGRLPARRVLVALDACFSGAGGRSVLVKGARPLVNRVRMGDEGSGKVVTLAAAGPDQISGTIDAEGHGLFTYYLLSGLNGAAKDESGRITAQSLYEYAAPSVQDAARRDNREQKPAWLGAAQAGAAFILRGAGLTAGEKGR